MPWNRADYPDDWEAIALAIKEKANWKCQECDRPCRKPGESFPDFLKRVNQRYTADVRPGQYTLTVAHLNHVPADMREENLKAMCASCHCRYDLKQMPLKQRLKKERLGQLRLDGVLS